MKEPIHVKGHIHRPMQEEMARKTGRGECGEPLATIQPCLFVIDQSP